MVFVLNFEISEDLGDIVVIDLLIFFFIMELLEIFLLIFIF